MTTTDINSSAQQYGPRSAHVNTPTNVFHVVRTWTLPKNSERCATWHVRGSPNWLTHLNYGYSLATNLHATQSGQSKNTATNIKFSNILFFSLHRPTLFHFTSHYFLLLYLSVMARSTIYINMNKQFKRGRSSFHNADDENNSNKGVQSNVHMSKTKHQLWQSTLKHRSGSPFSLTSPRLLARVLTVQSGTKTHILNKTMLLRCWRGACNLEASLNRASADAFLPRLPWGNTQVAGTGHTSWRSFHRDILHPSLLYHIRNPHTRSWCRIFRWRPDSSHCIPLLLWVF